MERAWASRRSRYAGHGQVVRTTHSCKPAPAGRGVEDGPGRRVWGRKKFTHKVSDPMERGSAEKVVTVSDEAFAILVYENYIDKWLRKYNCEQQGELGEDTNELEKRIKGRYTAGTTTRAANSKKWQRLQPRCRRLRDKQRMGCRAFR